MNKFWISFYEQAAQVRIPSSDENSVEYESQPHSQDRHLESDTVSEEVVDRTIEAGGQELSVAHTESSFAPGAGAVSSTPYSIQRSRSQSNAQASEKGGEESQASWAASIESPLERLDRGLKSLREDTSVGAGMGPPSLIPVTSFDRSTIVNQLGSYRKEEPSAMKSQDKGKGRQQTTLLQNVLSKNLEATDTSLLPSSSHATSPLKVKAKTPKRNPFVAPTSKKTDWDGIVDLKTYSPRKIDDSDFDSDDDDLPPGMSPPVTIDLPRTSRSVQRVGRTPVREAASRISKDLVGDIERRYLHFGLEPDASQSTSVSIPSLTPYSKRAISFENANSSAEPSIDKLDYQLDLQRLGGQAQTQKQDVDDSFDDSFDQTAGRFASVFQALGVQQGDGNDDSDSDFDESFEEPQPGVPSAAFLALSARSRTSDGSDSSSDSMGDENSGFPFNPQTEEDSFTDSLDGDANGETEEQTLFGVPRQRGAGQEEVRNVALTLRAQNYSEDTAELGQQAGLIPESPTPWGSVEEADLERRSMKPRSN